MKIKIDVEIPNGNICEQDNRFCQFYSCNKTAFGSEFGSPSSMYISGCSLFKHILNFDKNKKGFLKCKPCLDKYVETITKEYM